ncbi:hypothetical protein QQZ08_001841 [Neonectria magnoliae]|uniref:NACHT domain-containing protein n=1 Tax=Neonectria magnoliae TaxID=2732573 RepID=A0ABR1IDG0_9HYPO
MEQYGKVIEIFLNAAELLAFIWTASNFPESLNCLLDAYFELGELIPRLSQYQAHYISNEHMRTVLALMYKDILQFHAYAMKYFQKPTWKQLFQATWKGFAFKLEELKDNMRRHGRLVESQASIVQFDETQKQRRLAEISFQDLQNVYFRQRLHDVKQWLSIYNSKLQHDMCAKAKAECPGSGAWLLGDNRFKAWFDPIYCTTPLLWLTGIPGAGKTVLASTVVDAVQELVAKDQARIAYFYCNGTNDTRNSFVAVARGLLSQLLLGDQDLMLQLYDKRNLQSGEAILLEAPLTKELLDVALVSQKTTYLIIDGIDECRRDERKEICSWFSERINKLSKEDYGNLRCLFVSQEDGIAKKDLAMIPAIKILPVYIHDDIRRYVDIWREKIEAKHGPLDASQYPLTGRIMSSTRGMFLFAKLVVRYLHGMPTRKELLGKIQPGHFPEDIGELHLIRTKYLQVPDLESDLAQACLSFLSIEACGRDQDAPQVEHHLMKGYYSFLDYAVACWSLHLQSALPGISDNEKPGLLSECLEGFLDLHWSGPTSELTVSTTIMEKIKVFRDTDLFPKLAQAIVSARKQLGPSGKGPSPDDPLDLGQITRSIREAHA